MALSLALARFRAATDKVLQTKTAEDNIPTVSKKIWTTGENGISKQAETSLVTFYSGSLLLIICNSALWHTISCSELKELLICICNVLPASDSSLIIF